MFGTLTAVQSSTESKLCKTPFGVLMQDEHPALPRTEVAFVKAPRLVVRLYAASNQVLRAQLLNCLLRPLGLLGAVGAAAGAFADMALRRGANEAMVRIDDLNRITTAQVFELARFAQQVDPDALRQVASLVSQQPVGMATFTAAALVLLHQTLS